MPTFEVYRLLGRHWRLLGNIPAKDPRKAAIKAARTFNKMKLGSVPPDHLVSCWNSTSATYHSENPKNQD